MDRTEWSKVLTDWYGRVEAYQAGQYAAATDLSRRYYVLGIPVTVLAAVTGTTVFANLNKEFSWTARVTVVVVSLLAAVLSALNTFLNLGARSEQSRSVAAQFGLLRRRIQVLQLFPPDTTEGMRNTLEDLNTEIGKVSADAPLIEPPRSASNSHSGHLLVMLEE